MKKRQNLGQQALRKLAKLMCTELGETIKRATTYQNEMEAIFSFFGNYMHTPLYQGGCPLLNMAATLVQWRVHITVSYTLPTLPTKRIV